MVGNNNMKICFARPITGLSYDEVAGSYDSTKDNLLKMGYEHVYFAFTGKSYLKDETSFMASGYKHSLSTDHAITLRDRWMVKQSDVFFLNLLGTTKVSIGCMMELAWAFDNGKHVVTLMEENNIHSHAFVIESSHVIYRTEDEAMRYLWKLVRMVI